jgi:uncharacterized protein YdeI (YjbR/CyaY-like superfamily)
MSNSTVALSVVTRLPGVFFQELPFSDQQRIMISIEAAKTPETRERPIVKTVSSLRDGRI